MQLYGKFIDIFLDDRIEKKRDGNGFFSLGKLKRDEARAATIKGFHCLGWVLFHQEKELSNIGITIDKQVIDCLEQAGYSNEDAEAILSFWQEAGVQESSRRETDVQKQETGVQKSFHQTFWPYAVACKLHDDWQTDAENAWQFLSSAIRELPYASRLHHPAWQEPILMLAALMAEKKQLNEDNNQLDNLIGRLLSKRDKEERYLHQNLRLAAAILGEVGAGKVNPRYEKHIINQLGQVPKDHTWKRMLVQFSFYAAAIIALYLLLPLWAFGSIVFIGIYSSLNSLSAFSDDSPPNALSAIMGLLWMPLVLIFSLILIPINVVLSLPLYLLSWQAWKADQKNYEPKIQFPPKYIWEHWLFQRIALFTGCALVVFIFYQLFPLWLWGVVLLLWLFDIVDGSINRYNASGVLRRLSRPIGKGLGLIHRHLTTLLLNLFRPSTINANANSDTLAKIGSPAIPQLKQMLNTNLQDVRLAVIAALAQTKSSETTEILAQPLIYGNETERNLAMEALVSIGDPSAIPALVFVWENRVQGHDDRKAIIQALMKIDKQVSLPIIANMVGDYDQHYEILNPPELIKNYVPPSYSSGPLSLEERIFHIYVKLSAIWNGLKNLPFFALDNEAETYHLGGPGSSPHQGGSEGGIRL